MDICFNPLQTILIIIQFVIQVEENQKFTYMDKKNG